MINAKGSVVVGDERANRVLAKMAVVPDRSGEGEQALKDTGDDASPGAAAMALQVELALQGVVHRLDDLAERLQESRTGARGFTGHLRADERRVVLAQERLELGAPIPLVGHDDLARALSEQTRLALEQVTQHLALVVFRVGEGEGHRQTLRRADEMETETPEVAAVAGAVAVADEIGALGGLTRPSALDRRRVDEPGVVEPALGLDRKEPDDGAQLEPSASEPLVVAGLAGHVGEQMAQVRRRVAEKPGLGAEAEQRLDDAEREQFGVGQLRAQ